MSSVAVIDTNVLIAGILTSDALAPTARIVDGMLSRRFAFALSEALLSEYREVLLRPRIRVRHGLDERSVDEILTRLALEAIVVEPESGSTIAAPDSGGQFLWDLLAALEHPVLVTGDGRLRKGGLPSGSALSPTLFCETVSI